MKIPRASVESLQPRWKSESISSKLSAKVENKRASVRKSEPRWKKCREQMQKRSKVKMKKA